MPENALSAALLSAADAMHKEILRQIDELMEAEADTKETTLLASLVNIAVAYETERFPL